MSILCKRISTASIILPVPIVDTNYDSEINCIRYLFDYKRFYSPDFDFNSILVKILNGSMDDFYYHLKLNLEHELVFDCLWYEPRFAKRDYAATAEEKIKC